MTRFLTVALVLVWLALGAVVAVLVADDRGATLGFFLAWCGGVLSTVLVLVVRDRAHAAARGGS